MATQVEPATGQVWRSKTQWHYYTLLDAVNGGWNLKVIGEGPAWTWIAGFAIHEDAEYVAEYVAGPFNWGKLLPPMEGWRIQGACWVREVNALPLIVRPNTAGFCTWVAGGEKGRTYGVFRLIEAMALAERAAGAAR